MANGNLPGALRRQPDLIMALPQNSPPKCDAPGFTTEPFKWNRAFFWRGKRYSRDSLGYPTCHSVTGSTQKRKTYCDNSSFAIVVFTFVFAVRSGPVWRQDLAILSPEGPRDSTCQLHTDRVSETARRQQKFEMNPGPPLLFSISFVSIPICFFVRFFPFLSKDFRGSAKRKTPFFFGFPCFFSPKKREGWRVREVIGCDAPPP